MVLNVTLDQKSNTMQAKEILDNYKRRPLSWKGVFRPYTFSSYSFLHAYNYSIEPLRKFASELKQ